MATPTPSCPNQLLSPTSSPVLYFPTIAQHVTEPQPITAVMLHTNSKICLSVDSNELVATSELGSPSAPPGRRCMARLPQLHFTLAPLCIHKSNPNCFLTLSPDSICLPLRYSRCLGTLGTFATVQQHPPSHLESPSCA